MKIRKIKKARIAILIDSWFPVYSGKQIHVAELAHALVTEHDYEVDILTRQHKGSLSADAKALEKIPNLEVKRFGSFQLIYAIRVFIHLLQNRGNYTLMHAHSAGSALVMKLASWFTRVPTVLTIHSNQIFKNKWTPAKIFHRVMFLETKYSQEISVAENFLKAKNVNKNVSVIPHGVDVDKYDLIDAKKNPAQFNVLYIGRLVHEKGVDNLLKALKQLLESSEFIQSKKDFMLHIVGEGYEDIGLKKLALKLGVEKYLRFHGRVIGDERVEMYKSSDLFVLPSRSEGLSMTLLEACAAGLPILATNVGDNKRLVLENTNGHLIQPDDIEELSYYLEYFALNPHLEKMGEASRELVIQEYNWENSVAKVLRVYESLEPSEKTEYLMPWHLPLLMFRKRHFLGEYKGRKPLKFCLSVNIEKSRTEELGFGFLERFMEFCSGLGVASTIFVQEDLIGQMSDALRIIQKDGYEIGIYGQKKSLRGLSEFLKELKLKNLSFYRSSDEINDSDLEYIQERGYEYLPTSSDPLPAIKWRYALPFGEMRSMNLKYFLAMKDEDLLAAVNRLRAYQAQHGLDPFLIFESSNLEFESNKQLEYAGGENFTNLSRKIAFLKEHMELKFMTLSEFTKSCSVSP